MNTPDEMAVKTGLPIITLPLVTVIGLIQDSAAVIVDGDAVTYANIEDDSLMVAWTDDGDAVEVEFDYADNAEVRTHGSQVWLKATDGQDYALTLLRPCEPILHRGHCSARPSYGASAATLERAIGRPPLPPGAGQKILDGLAARVPGPITPDFVPPGLDYQFRTPQFITPTPTAAVMLGHVVANVHVGFEIVRGVNLGDMTKEAQHVNVVATVVAENGRAYLASPILQAAPGPLNVGDCEMLQETLTNLFGPGKYFK